MNTLKTLSVSLFAILIIGSCSVLSLFDHKEDIRAKGIIGSNVDTYLDDNFPQHKQFVFFLVLESNKIKKGDVIELTNNPYSFRDTVTVTLNKIESYYEIVD